MSNEARRASKNARRRRKRKQQKQLQNVHATQLEPQPQISSSQMWFNTYQKLTQWQQTHLLNYNCSLQQQQQQNPDYVCVAEEGEEEEEDTVDPGYLDFLMVTMRHQQELKERRDRDSAASVETSHSPEIINST
ncbi:uncharacterized protein LOC115631817 [Scaptodrosophila lebanonensis]|uniref:Uncharacterized protein LOC115631817 n=1 Tax=Drosophila lebanonensis TaxID=7225 RepID=A0A6J2U851_DROLE|nr:uncharacterized protein LOC115631817 [Scaptodrosophila lebanonensis]